MGSSGAENDRGSLEPVPAVYDPPPALDRALAALPLVPLARPAPRRIGYLVNYSFHIWYQILMEVMRRRAAQYGAELLIADAHLSVARQIEEAQALLDEVDALVLTPAATSGPEKILKLGEERGIEVVVEANPLEGMKTLVAICDYDAGLALGRWVGENIKGESGRLNLLDVALPTLRPCLLRSEGFIDGLRSVQPDVRLVARVNGEGSPIIARREAARVVAAHPEIDLIFAMDDETAHGAYRGYVDAGGVAEKVAVAAFGLAGDEEKRWLMERGALKVSAAMFPEYVAVRCIDDLMRLVNGESLNRRDQIPTLPMTPELLPRFYPLVEGAWTPDFEAISALPVAHRCARE